MTVKQIAAQFYLCSIALIVLGIAPTIAQTDTACYQLISDYNKCKEEARIRFLAKINFEQMFESYEPYLCFANELLKNESVKRNNDLLKHIFRIKGDALSSSEDYISAIDNYQQSLETEQEKNGTLTEYYASCIADIAYCYLMLNNYSKVIEFSSAAAIIAKQLSDIELLSDSYSNIGSAYFSMGKLDSALAYYGLVLDYDRQRGDREKIGVSLNNIGRIFSQSKRYDQAIHFYKQALEISIALNNLPQKANRLSNLGNAYFLANRLDSAEYCFIEAQELNQKIGNQRKKALDLSNIAMINFEKGKTKVAIDNFEKAIKIAMDYNYDDLLTGFYYKLGDIYSAQKLYTDAIKYYRLSYNFGEKIGAEAQLFNTSYKLYQIYKQTGNIKEALNYMEIYSSLRDSIHSDETRNQQLEFAIKYETERKEQKIVLLQNEKELHQLQIKRNNIVLFFSVIVILLISLTSFLYFRRYRDKQYLNSLLELKNEELRALYESKNRFLSLIAHDLRGSMWSFNNLTTTMIENFDQFDHNQILSFLLDLNTSSFAVNELLNNLLMWENISQSTIKYEPETVNLSTMVDETLSIFKLSAKEKDITVQTFIPNEYEVFADLHAIMTVLRNLLSNAIKYTPIAGEVTISAQKQDSLIQLAVADNGTGIDATQLKMLFDNKDYVKIKQHSTGLGLKLCKELVVANGGKIWAENIIPTGVVFYVLLKKQMITER